MKLKPTDETTITAPSGEEGGATPDAGLSQISTIVDDLSATMPDVQPHALESLDSVAHSTDAGAPVDVDGNAFDPAIHRTKPDGTPVISAKNKLVKKAGRKAGTTSSTKPASVIASQSEAQQQQKSAMAARMSGIAAANMLMQVGIVLGGDEFRPQVNAELGLNEKQMLEESFANYFEATGKTDIPAGWALTFAVSAYIMPRFTMPKTQKRVGGVWSKLKSWYVSRKLKKHGLKAVSDKDEKSAV